MFYDYVLTIPASTPDTSPIESEACLTHGVITHIEVEFPPGCAGLAHAYIRYGLHQLFPTNPDGNFKTDGSVIRWNEYYELFYPPYSLIIGGWNEDDTYQHELLFRFEVTSREVAERGKMVETWIGRIRRLLGV